MRTCAKTLGVPIVPIPHPGLKAGDTLFAKVFPKS